jgi:hypothetical protein
MKTLVIHPTDPTTTFLSKIYEGKDWTIFNGHRESISMSKFHKLVNEHDRIIMMGHGAPTGLFYSHVNHSLTPILREKNCVFIWCNADQFVHDFGLKGFFTGMFISEVQEARWFNIETTQQQIDFSNHLFTDLVAENIDNPDIHKVLKENYYSPECPVIQFNNDRLYTTKLILS